MVNSLRYAGFALGFALGVVWMTVGLGSAILVLLCTALGYGVAFVAEHERTDLSKLRPTRLVNAMGNSWFALGPVAVLAIANIHPQDAAPALLVAALLAQFLADTVASAVRFAITREAGPPAGPGSCSARLLLPPPRVGRRRAAGLSCRRRRSDRSARTRRRPGWHHRRAHRRCPPRP